MPEKEYIEREAVCSKCKNKSHCEVSFYEKQKCPVYKASAADVAEVKRGEWVEYQTPNIICCSECDWATGVDEKSFKFCPNCGADMRGKKNG